MCFAAAALQDRNKNTYNYNYCYAEEEILEQGIEPKPYVFGYTGEYQAAVYNYDMTVNGISVMRDDSDYGSKRYFLTLNCVGKNRDNNAERNYEVQLAIYPETESIAGSFATQGSSTLLYSSNSYVKDLKINKTRYLANDSLSTIKIADKGNNQYSFYGGTLTCTDMDANYMAVYGKKRIEAVHYYHFSDNGGAGIPFGYDESSKEVILNASSAAVEETINGIEITLQTKDSNNIAYTVYVILESENIDGAFTTNDNLSTWSKVERGVNGSYIAAGSTVTINAKSGNKHTISANLLCENEFTYKLNAFDFTYVGQPTGIESIQSSAVSTQKVVLDGQMFILRGEKIFDAQGKQVK